MVRHKIVYNDESKHKFRYFQFNPPKIGSTKKKVSFLFDLCQFDMVTIF